MSDGTGLKKPMPTRLWPMLALIVISVIMGVISLFYSMYSFAYQYVPGLPTFSPSIGFLLTTMCTFDIALFVLSFSLLLMFITTAKKGLAAWARLLFFAGAIMQMAGAFFRTAYYWWINHLQDYPWSDAEYWYKVVLVGQIVNGLGVVICLTTALLLIWCYLKGEIYAKPKESYSL